MIAIQLHYSTIVLRFEPTKTLTLRNRGNIWKIHQPGQLQLISLRFFAICPCKMSLKSQLKIRNHTVHWSIYHYAPSRAVTLLASRFQHVGVIQKWMIQSHEKTWTAGLSLNKTCAFNWWYTSNITHGSSLPPCWITDVYIYIYIYIHVLTNDKSSVCGY